MSETTGLLLRFWLLGLGIASACLLWGWLQRWLIGRRERKYAKETERILHAYGDLLCDDSKKWWVQDETVLPASKEKVKRALTVATFTAQTDEELQNYKGAYMQLAHFQPGVGQTVLLDVADLNRFVEWTERVNAESVTLRRELTVIQKRMKRLRKQGQI